jgi:1,6-anhydro-N-acetylmuramate kinase
MSTTSADRLQAALVELTPAQALTRGAALTAVVAEALAETGRTLDDLSATEAIELADGLRAIVAENVVAENVVAFARGRSFGPALVVPGTPSPERGEPRSRCRAALR